MCGVSTIQARYVLLLLLAVSASLSAGCDSPRAGHSWFREAEPEVPAAAAATDEQPTFGALAAPSPDSTADAIVVVQMLFDVVRVEMEIDEIHHSDKTWNHVDELRCDPARIALLRRNGLRMGVASEHDWPALRAIFEAGEAQVLGASHTVGTGHPLTLELDQIVDDEVIFLTRADDRAVGTTFDRGAKYLHLDYAVDRHTGDTTLMVTPEIHRLSRAKYWRSQGGAVQRVPAYRGKVYHELTASMRVSPGEYLVIGPDNARAGGLCVGQKFLTRTERGRKYETVLCITPRPFGNEVTQR